MTRLIEDLSKLSNIDIDILAKLFEKVGECIAQKVYEDRLKVENTTMIDLDFGVFEIKNDEGKLKIKFSPSSSLLEDLVNIEKGKSPKLIKKLEKVTVTKLLETYKSLD